MQSKEGCTGKRRQAPHSQPSTGGGDLLPEGSEGGVTRLGCVTGADYTGPF